jgi:hypothetical protein
MGASGRSSAVRRLKSLLRKGSLKGEEAVGSFDRLRGEEGTAWECGSRSLDAEEAAFPS